MFPTKELLLRRSICNRKRRPISGGISPESELFWTRIAVRKVRFPMEGDKVPNKPAELRFKTVTLWSPGTQVIPRHWQNGRESLFHDDVKPCGSSVIMDLMASNAKRSPSAAAAAAVVVFCAAAVMVAVEKAAIWTNMRKRNGVACLVSINGSHLVLISENGNQPITDDCDSI